jgi:hypothetical protein
LPTGGVVGELSTVVVVEGERTGGEWGVVHRGTEVVGWIGDQLTQRGFGDVVWNWMWKWWRARWVRVH